jgi:hypothetical protein
MNPIKCRLKKGETDPETGLIVYRYFSHDPSKPYLVTPEKFKAIRDKEEARKAKWAYENKHRGNASKSAWLLRNKKTARAKIASDLRIRRKVDPLFNLKDRVRARMSCALRERKIRKNSPTEAMLGCDWDFLMKYIESQFGRGMNWGNKHKWHVDHIIPLASASSEEDLLKLCRYTNLQPLWSKENLEKRDRQVTHQMILI